MSSEPKHTPEWYVDPDPRDNMEQNFHIVDKRGRAICFCSTGWPDVETARAHADLIAAAPELLRALNDLLRSEIYADAEGLLTVERGGCDDKEHREIVARCKSAIAKANAT